MPIVPDNRQLISMNVAEAPSTFQGAGLVGEAMANVGQQVAQTTNSLMKEIIREDAIQSARATASQAKLDSVAYINKLKIKHPNGYTTDESGATILKKNVDPNGKNQPYSQDAFMNIHDTYSEFLDQRRKEDLDKLSGLGRQIYEGSMDGFYTEQKIRAQADFIQTRVDSVEAEIKDRYSKIANKLALTPKIEDMYDHANDFHMEIESVKGLLGTQKAQKLQESITEESINSFVNGGINQATEIKRNGGSRLPALQKMLDVVQGKDPMSIQRKNMGLPVLAEMMKPAQRNADEAKILAQMSVIREMDIRDYKTELAASKIAPLNSIDTQKLIAQTISLNKTTNANGSPVIPNFEAQETITELKTREVLKKYDNQSFYNLPYSAQKGILNGEANSLVNSEEYRALPDSVKQVAVSSGSKVFSQFINKIEDEKQKDFTAYALKSTQQGKILESSVDFASPQNFPQHAKEIEDFQKAHDELYYANYGDDRKYYRAMSKDQSLSLRGAIVGTNQAADNITAMKRSMSGKTFNSYINTAVADGLPASYLTAGLINNPLVLSSYIGAINSKEKETNDLVEAKGGKNNEFKREADSSLLKLVALFQMQNPDNPDNKNLAFSVYKGGEMMAKNDFLVNGTSGSEMQSFDKAEKMLIDDSVELYENGRELKGLVAIDKRMDPDSIKYIKNFVDTSLSNKNLLKNDLKIVVPTKSSGDPSKFSDES